MDKMIEKGSNYKSGAEIKELQAENEKLLKQLQDKYRADNCLLVAGEVWANILEDRHKLHLQLSKSNDRVKELEAEVEKLKKEFGSSLFRVTKEVKDLQHRLASAEGDNKKNST